MRNLTLHKFLAMLLMTVSCATLSVAQNVAKNVAKIGTTEYATLKAAVDDAANASGKVYNLQGVVVGNTTEGLPKGVYIKNGRKIIVK